MAVMDELEQDLICRLFSIDFVQGKEEKLIGTCIDHYVEDEYSEERLFHFNPQLTGKWVICVTM